MDVKKRGKVSFVLLNKDNIDFLVKLEHESEKIVHADEPRSLEEIKEKIRNRDRVVIQLYEGKPAGYFEIRHHNLPSGKRINEIAFMYVKDEFKGRGLSRKMHKEAVRISEMEGIPIFANSFNKVIAKKAVKNLEKIIKAKADKSKRQSIIEREKMKKKRH